MKRLLVFSILLMLFSCNKVDNTVGISVSNQEELNDAIKNAKPGDVIVMANGIWTDVSINFKGYGSQNSPIKLIAESAGKVILEGQSYLRLGGEYLEVHNLYFKNGYSPKRAVIDFRIDKELAANNSKVIGCVIEDFTQLDRFKKDHWVEFWGRHNELRSCYISGKSNKGPTVRVMLAGNQHANSNHIIADNYFGPRPRKGGPQGETMQIGDSYTSMVAGYIQVENNLFDHCDGEVEIISSKSNYNTFRNNVFYKSEGSLVLRHGNYATIDGNWFIGDDNSNNIGGVRVINTGHWIINNYFYKINGESFRSPIAVMNGIPKSPLNRYNQVTDAVIAYNTWVDCKTPLQFSVGTNVDKVGVLPKSEIRSALPIRTVVANNLIYNQEKTDFDFIKFHDKRGDITFSSNLVNENNNKYDIEGFEYSDLNLSKVTENLFVPEIELTSSYLGFDFDKIENDILGASRADKNIVGAIIPNNTKASEIVDKTKYGPQWYRDSQEEKKIAVHAVKDIEEFKSALEKANSGDILELESVVYKFNFQLVISKDITIKTKGGDSKAIFIFNLNNEIPAFVLNPGIDFRLDGVEVKSESNSVMIAPNKENMSIASNVFINNSSISDFSNIYKSYKGSFADTISVKNSSISNIGIGFELAEESDAKGDYNVEFLILENNEIENVKGQLVNYYRGGYDESTIGGNFLFRSNKVKNAGQGGKDAVLMRTHGIVNVEISDNKFEGIKSSKIALLWGEKNNVHMNNEVKGSSKIIVQEHLTQKLVY